MKERKNSGNRTVLKHAWVLVLVVPNFDLSLNYGSNERTWRAKASRFSRAANHSLARTGNRNSAQRHMYVLNRVDLFWCVSSRVGNKGWDRTQFTTHSEGTLERLFERWHIMASVSEENSFGLAQDETNPSSTSGSRLTLGNSAPDSTANGQNCTSTESVISAFQVKGTHSPSPVVNVLVIIAFDECNTWLLTLHGSSSPRRIFLCRVQTIQFVVSWRRRNAGPQNCSRG